MENDARQESKAGRSSVDDYAKETGNVSLNKATQTKLDLPTLITHNFDSLHNYPIVIVSLFRLQ